MPVVESKLYGSSRHSYADMDECRLLIKHDGAVNDDVHGSRSRRIKDIFIETPIGERLHVPFKNLHGARAMCRHVGAGGQMHDEIGECITNMVKEMSSMSHFVRSTKNRQFEDAETSDMARAATQHYMGLKNTLRHLANKKHYQEFVETYCPDETPGDDIDVDALRERFVKKVYDDRFTDALPVVYKAYKKYKTESAMELGDELSEWADDVTESVWDESPSEHEVKFDALQDKVNKPWPVGVDGIDATTDLKAIFPGRNLTELNNSIYHYSQDQGPDADVVPLVKTWLGNTDPELLSKLQFGQNNGNDATTNHINPVSPKSQPSNTYGADMTDDPVTDPNVKLREDDSLDFIRSLAGIRRK